MAIDRKEVGLVENVEEECSLNLFDGYSLNLKRKHFQRSNECYAKVQDRSLKDPLKSENSMLADETVGLFKRIPIDEKMEECLQ